jgi:type I restriction enzyme M protein
MTEQNINEQLLPDIMHYESDIWSIADLLRGAGIKDSKFPDYMMPYFALVMLEGRMKNEIARIEETDGITREEDIDGFVEYFKSMDCGYNDYIVRQNKTLQDICGNDKTFEQDFATYLKGFDNELKELLGIGRGTEDSKYLNIDGVNAELRKKKILQSVVTRWSMIELAGYDNSAITTLEEHIKRRWADISAETAGEQYTPDDIISLIAEIVAAKINFKKDSYLSLYDPTCGGANLLFGTSDRLNEAGYPYVATYGCDFNDALYALAKIESKFRQKSFIRYGNTLTTLPFRNQSFQVIVANPPYGVKWSGYENDIKKDQTGQFTYLPPVSDGQLLFMQHILYQLNEDGLAVEVHNGSTLFSGDADKGESNIRKMMMDHDWVEAIIQMPTDEFFNTGITTYLWIMNKNKPLSHRDKIMLIDASDSWKQLKKSKGKKRREMTAEDRKNIVEALLKFEDCEIGRVRGKKFPKWHFYYNKQSIKITDESETRKSVLDTICKNGKPCKLALDHIDLGEETVDKFLGLKIEAGSDTYARFNGFDYHDDRMVVTDNKGTEYWFDKDDNTIYSKTQDGKEEELGCGKFTFKISTSNKTDLSSISLVIEPAYISDYEIIPYKSEESENTKAIDAFLSKYVIKRFYKVSNAVGVEISFNKEFYVPEKLESVSELESEIKQLSDALSDLRNKMEL